jgi:hypothetical protein
MNMKLCTWALSAAVIAALVGCGSPAYVGTPDPVPPHSAATTHPACPEGTAYPPGTAGEVDYTDSILHDSVNYTYLPSVHVTIPQLGSVVAHIQCSMATYPDTHAPPSHWADDTATGLTVGTPLYAIRGFSPRCRLAANVGGHLHAYVAVKSTKRGPIPQSCAKVNQ